MLQLTILGILLTVPISPRVSCFSGFEGSGFEAFESEGSGFEAFGFEDFLSSVI